jgi:hypothetical protein
MTHTGFGCRLVHSNPATHPVLALIRESDA